MADSQYFHATIYKFDEQARRDVIRIFHETIQDVSARCSYDAKLDFFCLICPQNVGPMADEALRDAISTYVETELNTAELEERAPRLQRFQESCFEDPAFSHRLLGATLTEPTDQPLHATTSTKRPAPLVMHRIFVEQSATTSIKFFKLRALPEGLLERTLTSADSKTRKTLELGLTCRAVRWSSSQQEYTFNGRVGSPNDVDHSTSSDMPRSDFITLRERHSEAHKTDNALSQAPKNFKFVGDHPSLRQFLEGMGEIEADEPDVMPEAPKDAQKFINRPMEAISNRGRIRMPKAALESLDSSEDEDSDEDDRAKTIQPSFQRLLKAKNTKIGVGDDEEATSASDETVNDRDDRPSFRSLFSNTCATANSSAASLQPPLPKAETNGTASACSFACKEESQRSSISASASRADLGQTKHSQDRDVMFPDNSLYAKVDHVGFTSSATNQARWEHENPSPRKSKTNRSGIGRRTVRSQSNQASRLSTNFDSETMSQSTAPDFPANLRSVNSTIISSTESGSPTIRSCSDFPSEAGPWTNKVVHVDSAHRRLIDDSAPLTRTPTKLPPGLDYQDQVREAAQATNGKVYSKAPSHPQTLIDLCEGEAENAKPIGKISHRTQVLQPSSNTDTLSELASVHDVKDDGIHERLQATKPDGPRKRNTMRQKAGKKGKGKSAASKNKPKQNAQKGMLPMPDALPLPKKIVTAQKHNGSDDSKIFTDTAREPCAESSTVAKRSNDNSTETMADFNTEPKPAEGIEKLLEEVLPLCDITNLELDVLFGLILVKYPGEKDFSSGVLAPKTAETKLQEAAGALQTDFFPRMTTSDLEARYLFTLIDGDRVQASVEYEIHVKNVEGETGLLRFEQTSPEDFLVFRSETAVGKLFLHYPMRVWDAQAILNQPDIETELMNAAENFVLSIQTCDEPPSFRTVVSSQAFTVDKVLVKRVFRKKAYDDIEVKVTEVQDLMLESINYDSFNLKATALTREAMIEYQRLWWECRLHLESVDASSGLRLQLMVDDMVTKMDGVGFENQGPFIRTEIEEKLEQSGEEPPFW